MNDIVIVTDSTADIPDDLAKKLNITVIPLTIHADDKAYWDRVDISNEAMYELLKTAETLPTTSQPSPSLFIETYRRLADNGAKVIFSLHLSALLSGTVNGARMAARQLDDRCDIRVVDSRSATMGLGLLAVSLAEKVREGADADACGRFLEEAIGRMKLYFLLDSLDNLEKGGRIGKAGYLVGSILNIKPLLQLQEGTISAHKKIRGNKDNRAIAELARTILAEIDAHKKVYITIGYNNNRDFAEKLEELLLEVLPQESIAFYQLGSVVTTHIGLGAVGAAFFQ